MGLLFKFRLKKNLLKVETIPFHLRLFFSFFQASAGSENEFVSAVVGGIPTTALSRGVYTEQSLRERFTRVETVARRVGAIGDDGGSLLRSVLFAFGDIIVGVLIMLRNLLAQCYSFISITFSHTCHSYICSVADPDRGSGALLTPGLQMLKFCQKAHIFCTL
jgi:hypothetical protein